MGGVRGMDAAAKPPGWVYGVPAIRHLPASPRNTPERFGFGLAGQRPALPRVQGATLQRKRPPFGGLTFSLLQLDLAQAFLEEAVGGDRLGYRLGFSG